MIIRGCLLVILLLAGCAGPMATASGPSSPSPPASEPPIASASAGASYGPSAVPRASVPPLPDGFPLHASMEAREAGPELTAAWVSDALPPEIYDFYLDALASAGFGIDLEGPGGEAAILRFHVKDGTAYQLTFTGSGPVTVELGPPRP